MGVKYTQMTPKLLGMTLRLLFGPHGHAGTHDPQDTFTLRVSIHPGGHQKGVPRVICMYKLKYTQVMFLHWHLRTLST